MKKVLIILVVFSLVGGFVFSNTATLNLFGQIPQDLQLRIANFGSTDFGTDKNFDVLFDVGDWQNAADLRERANVPFKLEVISANSFALQHTSEATVTVPYDLSYAGTDWVNAELVDDGTVILKSIGTFGALDAGHAAGLVETLQLKLTGGVYAGLAGDYADVLTFTISAL